LVIKTLDPDWIQIGIGMQPKMLDPDPDQINTDPKHCYGENYLQDLAKMSWPPSHLHVAVFKLLLCVQRVGGEAMTAHLSMAQQLVRL
jgi:hypothetical protein